MGGQDDDHGESELGDGPAALYSGAFIELFCPLSFHLDLSFFCLFTHTINLCILDRPCHKSRYVLDMYTMKISSEVVRHQVVGVFTAITLSPTLSEVPPYIP